MLCEMFLYGLMLSVVDASKGHYFCSAILLRNNEIVTAL